MSQVQLNMSTKLVLYQIAPSPPVRAVKVLAAALGVDLELKTVDLMNGEHLKDDYLKINPNHTVPTLVDNGTILWDSHAILMYLCDKYGGDNDFYPKDLIRRSTVNQLLFLESSLFQKLIQITKPIFMGNKEIPETKIVGIKDSYSCIERILKDKIYLTGDKVSIADISLIATLSSLNLLIPIDEKVFPHIVTWMKKMEILPYYGPNAEGLEHLKVVMKKYLG